MQSIWKKDFGNRISEHLVELKNQDYAQPWITFQYLKKVYTEGASLLRAEIYSALRNFSLW